MRAKPSAAWMAVEVHPLLLAQAVGLAQRLPQRRHQGGLVLHRLVVAPAARHAVDGQRLLQVAEHPGVVHDQPAHLAGIDPVGPGDGLHQGVVAHRLVEIERRAARHVEAGHPHGADEDQAEGVVRVLELGLQVLLHHALAVRPDVQPLVLPSRRSRSAPGRRPPPCRSLPCRRCGSAIAVPVVVRRPPVKLAPAARAICSPQCALHLVVHADRGGLVDADHHRLALEAPAGEMRRPGPWPPPPAGRRG